MGLKTDWILIEQFLINHPIDAIRMIEKLDTDNIVRLLDTIADELAGQICSNLDTITALTCLQKISSQKAAGIMDNIPIDIVLVLLKKMSKEHRQLMLDSLSEKSSHYLNIVLEYPEDTVGAIMDPSAYTLFEDILVADALILLKRQSEMNEYYLYVLTRNHTLAGVLSISELLRAKTNQPLGSLMNKNVVKILADSKQKVVLNHPGWQEYHVLPLVSSTDIFQGILHFSTLRRLNVSGGKTQIPPNLIKASSALGELYRLGIVSLIQGTSELYNKPDKKT